MAVASQDWPLSCPDQLRTFDGHRFKNAHDYLATCLAVAKKYSGQTFSPRARNSMLNA